MRRQNTFRFGPLILISVLAGLFAIAGNVSGSGSGGEPSGRVIELKEGDRAALSGLGKGVVGKALAAKPIHDAARLMPLTEGKWTYRVLAGDNKGKKQEDIIGRPKYDSMEKSWRRVVGRKFIEYYRLKGGGKIALVSEVDLIEDVITHYHPVFPVIFNGMGPGDKSEVQTDISVYDLHDPADEKYKGHLKVTHTYVGAYEILVPAGKYQTVLIKSTYVGKVGPASVNDFGYIFYAVDEGIVAAVDRSHVSAFLIYDKTTRTPKILLHE